LTAVRASELRSDVSKGAKLRKRKALSDLLQALGALGLSRHAKDVPPNDRTASAWFKHEPPGAALEGLLKEVQLGQYSGTVVPLVPPVAVEALEAGRALWSRSDVYYYRAIARLQMLQASAIYPHRDVSGGEATAATRLCEHSMYMCRKQRDALGGAAAAYTRLLRVSAWLEGLPGGAAAAEDDDESEAPFVAPQSLALAWMAAQQRSLERLSLLLREQSMLVGVLRDVAAVPGQQQQLIALAPRCEAWAVAAERCRSSLEAQALQCQLPSSFHPCFRWCSSCRSR
jgi:midasin